MHAFILQKALRKLFIMKRKRYFMQRYFHPSTVFFLFFLKCFFVSSALASDVYIKVGNNEVGQGVMRQRGSECLIVTPAHVVENAFNIEMTIADRTKYSCLL